MSNRCPDTDVPREEMGPGGRRDAIRHLSHVNQRIHVIVSDGRESRWALVRDVSNGGIGLLLSCPLDPGTVLSINLSSWSAHQSFARSASVVYAMPQGDGSWRIGCTFDSPLGASDLNAFL